MIKRKIEKLLYFIYGFIKYEKNFFEIAQKKIFDQNNLDRNKGIKIFRELINQNKALKSDMNSEHQIIFAALSNNKNYKIENILEIGTYDGKNALLLSKLFPNAKIQTIDLPHETKQFKATYNRKKKEDLEKFVNDRNQLIENQKNIQLIETNSINLVNEKKKFDLIWVDGAHGSPVVVIDIINSLRLSSLNSLILCDDIHVKTLKKQDPNYFSNASFETLNVLKDEKLIEFDLFFKRVANNYNYYPVEKKFIALIKKTSEAKEQKE